MSVLMLSVFLRVYVRARSGSCAAQVSPLWLCTESKGLCTHRRRAAQWPALRATCHV